MRKKLSLYIMALVIVAGAAFLVSCDEAVKQGAVSAAVNQRAATKAVFAEKILTGETVELNPNFPYYQNRSAESLASEVELNGIDAVHLLILDENRIYLDFIKELHDRGIAVCTYFFPTSVYTPEEALPEGWEKWQMEFTVPESHAYRQLSMVHKDYIQWHKERIARILEKTGSDGFVFAEPFYPGFDGLSKNPVEFSDVSEGFQQAFKEATGNENFPNFKDPNDPHYFSVDTKLFEELVDFRVKTIVDFQDGIINGFGGIREKFPNIVVGTWTTGAVLEGGVEKLRRWEGHDAEAAVRKVRPDFHLIQTHWPDWILSEEELGADYAKGYAQYIAAAKKGDPDVKICVQADLGSLDEMKKSAAWYRDFVKACGEQGIDSTTYYEFFLRGEVNFDAPVLKKITGGGTEIVKLYFDQVVDPDCASVLVGRVLEGKEESHTVTSAKVDGNIIILEIDKPAKVGEVLSVPVGGICDVPGLRFSSSEPKNFGPVGVIADGTVVEIEVKGR